MNILSLFDGISCAYVALLRAGITPTFYMASETDKYAIQISKKNFPDIIHVGDVRDVVGIPPSDGYDLLIGGSPCQDLSIAKHNRKVLQGEKSSLFWEYVRILKSANPKYFILENVASISQEAKQEITEALGVEPIMIDAALVSAQQRKRLFWTNIPSVEQPADKNIFLKDILLDGIAERDKSLVVTATYSRACPRDYFTKHSRQLIKVGHFNSGGQGDHVYSTKGKPVTPSATGVVHGSKTRLYETTQGVYRKLHPVECERLQGLPDNYTDGISHTQRYKCLGNAFNVDVVAHILSFIPKL